MVVSRKPSEGRTHVSALIKGATRVRPYKTMSRYIQDITYIMGVKPRLARLTLASAKFSLIRRPEPGGAMGRRASSRCSLVGLAAGQGEIKTGPAVDLAFGPDAAAVTLDDALHQGQPHPGAFKFLIAVQPLKHPE